MTAANGDHAAIEPDVDADVPRASIRTTLAALVAACLVPPLIGLLAMMIVSYRVQEAAVLGETVTRARTMMLFVERDMDGIESALHVLASASELNDGDLAHLHERLREALKTQAVDSFVLVDRDGRVRLDTRRPYGTATAVGEMPDALKPVFATGQTVVSGVVAAQNGGAPTVTMAVPIFRGTEVAYALAVTMSPDQFVEETRDSLPDGWIAAIIDHAGRFVARTRDSTRSVGTPASATLLDAIAGKDEGTAETLTREGEVVLTAFIRSDKLDWTVAVGAPRSLLVAALYRSTALIVAWVVVALALVLWFALRVSRLVTRAVTSLVDPALALGNGRPIDLPRSPLRETDAVVRAIRQASRMLAMAQHHAYHDPLTNLRNRTLFDEMATRQIAQAYRDGAQFAVLAIDLDGFKAVNDQHGHAMGDQVLKHVADRITGLIRATDVVSRLGGDEFAVLLVDVDGVKTRQVAEKLLAALAQPYPDVVPRVSASIGVARYPHDATTLPELMARADEALYEAKNAGKSRVAGDL